MNQLYLDLIGLVSLILFVSDMVIYVLAFRWFIVEKFIPVDKLNLNKFWRSSAILSIPILLIATPMIIAGVGRIINEDAYLDFVRFSIDFWGATVGIYSLLNTQSTHLGVH